MMKDLRERKARRLRLKTDQWKKRSPFTAAGHASHVI
jgi:hypothetical protein